MPQWYGQYKQDRYVVETFFPGVTRGVFVDVGASDGRRFSNTLALEQLGWTGLCVEPRPSAAALCRQCRSCPVEAVAIAAVEGTTEFLDISGYGEGLSGIVTEYDPRHVERINKELRHPDCKGAVKRTVPTVPLQTLLDKHGIQKIHYLSLDTEGSELTVLKTIDWSRVHIDVIDVEVNYDALPVTDYLIAKGYKPHSTIGCDIIFTWTPAGIQVTNALGDKR